MGRRSAVAWIKSLNAFGSRYCIPLDVTDPVVTIIYEPLPRLQFVLLFSVLFGSVL